VSQSGVEVVQDPELSKDHRPLRVAVEAFDLAVFDFKHRSDTDNIQCERAVCSFVGRCLYVGAIVVGALILIWLSTPAGVKQKTPVDGCEERERDKQRRLLISKDDPRCRERNNS
jgi:hypothetical protein